MSAFSSATFSTNEIFQLLSNGGYAIKLGDLKNPSSGFVCKLYLEILDRIDPLWCDIDGQLSFGALEMLDNPDYHADAIRKAHLLQKMNLFLASVQNGEVSVKDLLRPDPSRTLEILSCLINYTIYMEEKTKLLGQFVDEMPSIEERKNKIKERIAETTRSILEHEVKCEKEQPLVEELDAEVKKLKEIIQNYKKEHMSYKDRGHQLQEQMKAINDKISQANYELLRCSQENSKLSSKIVQSPDKLQRALEEKKVTRAEVLGAENAAKMFVKERTLRLDVYSKGREKMSKCVKKIEVLQEQAVVATKVIDKEIKALKVKFSDDGLLNKSLEAQISEAKTRGSQTIDTVRTVENEHDIKVAENTQKLNNLKSEMEMVLHSLKQRELVAEAIVAKGEKLNNEIYTVREEGKGMMHQLINKRDLIYQEYRKYVDDIATTFDEIERIRDSGQ